MVRRPRLFIVELLVVAGCCTALVPRDPVIGCAPAPPPGAIVQIASEAAIIVWDATAKREHFIRRASFDSSARDFGFLVPTPSKPTLTEVDEQAFAHLARVTAPRIEYVKRPVQAQPGCACSADGSRSAGVNSAPPNAVRVLEETQIAGQDIAVLEADDSQSLETWLKEHGYEFSPKLAAWVQPYLEKKWVITAFKYAQPATAEEKSTALESSAVCMSFETDQPFYPYREPAADAAGDAGPSERLLRVFLLANERMQGKLDADAKWPGETVYARRLKKEDQQSAWGMLKLASEPDAAALWLTEFEDRASPRPGTADLYFSPAEDKSQVERPPSVQYVYTPGLPIDLSFTMLAAGLLLFGVARLRPERR